MQTYDIDDGKGRLYAFEVDQDYLVGPGRRAVFKIIKKRLPEAKILTEPHLIELNWFSKEVFCEFEVSGVIFQALEPWGDSSRHWIGPKDGAWHSEIAAVKKAFT